MDKATLHAIERNRHWKNQLGWNLGQVIQAMDLDHNVNVETKLFIDKVRSFQRERGLNADGIIGPSTFNEIKNKLNIGQSFIDKIVAATIAKESGGDYSAMNLDGEFRGRFDTVWMSRHGKKHPASGKTHIGLSFGIIQFTQDGGALGDLVRSMLSKNPEKFKRIVGSTWQELVNVLTAPGRSGLNSGALRGPRVQKVRVKIGEGELEHRDLWESPWTEIFNRLGRDAEFQSVQNEMAVALYLKPITPTLKSLGLTSEKAVAMAFDLAVHRGVSGARSFINSRVGQSETETLKNIAKDNVRSKDILNDSLLSFRIWGGWPSI